MCSADMILVLGSSQPQCGYNGLSVDLCCCPLQENELILQDNSVLAERIARVAIARDAVMKELEDAMEVHEEQLAALKKRHAALRAKGFSARRQTANVKARIDRLEVLMAADTKQLDKLRVPFALTIATSTSSTSSMLQRMQSDKQSTDGGYSPRSDCSGFSGLPALEN